MRHIYIYTVPRQWWFYSQHPSGTSGWLAGAYVVVFGSNCLLSHNHSIIEEKCKKLEIK
jgi:hypothetical protein